MPRVILVPGHVSSITDGQVHWISADKLARLWNVPLPRCVVWDYRTDAGRHFRPAPTDITLYPDSSGRYDPAKSATARAALGLEG
jgi:hypothetical protein